MQVSPNSVKNNYLLSCTTHVCNMFELFITFLRECCTLFLFKLYLMSTEVKKMMLRSTSAKTFNSQPITFQFLDSHNFCYLWLLFINLTQSSLQITLSSPSNILPRAYKCALKLYPEIYIFSLEPVFLTFSIFPLVQPYRPSSWQINAVCNCATCRIYFR